MPLSLNNVICICAVDTQAEISLIDSHSSLLVPGLIKPIEGYFRTAMGHLVPKSGVFEMVIDYDGIKWNHEFQIGNIFDPIKFNFQIIVGKDLLRRMNITLTQVCFPRPSRNLKSECDVEGLDKFNGINGTKDSETEAQMVANKIDDLLKINEALPWGAKIEPVKLKLKSDVDFDKMNKKNYGESYHLRPLVDAGIARWEKSTIVSERTEVSPVNHPLVIVPKIPVPKDENDIRICLDFRELNMCLAEDSIDNFKLPEIFRSLQERFGGMKVFSEIDLTNAFNQIPLHENSKFLTCFTHNRKQFAFNFLPFGIKYISNLFQRILTVVLRPHQEYTFIYVDNVVIMSADLENHVTHLRAVLKTLNEYGFKIKTSKLKVGLRKIEILGHWIQDGQIKISPNRLKQVDEFPLPKSKEQILSFLGVCIQVIHLVKDFAEMAAPLYDMCKGRGEDGGKGVIVLSEEAKNAFYNLKQAIKNDLSVFLPDFSKEFRVRTDASRSCIGAILFQVNDLQEIQVVEYFSRKITGAEHNYSIYKLELLAVVEALAKFRFFLLGGSFRLETDHRPLMFLLSSKNLSPCLASWLDNIQVYNMRIDYIPGKTNNIADYLSRMGDDNVLPGVQEDHSSQLSIIGSEENIFDKEISFEHKLELVKQEHDKFHPGTTSLMRHLIINKGCTWSDMEKVVQHITKTCIPCLRFNISRTGFYNLKSIQGAAPMAIISLDIAQMPKSHDDIEYFILIIDTFSNFCWIETLQKKDSIHIIHILWSILCNFGMPRVIRCDNESILSSKVVESFCKTAGIRQQFSIEYVHRTNGLPERYIGISKAMLFKLAMNEIVAWPDYVTWVQYFLNHTIRQPLGISAFNIMFGRGALDFMNPKELSPIDLSFENEMIATKLVEQWMGKWTEIKEFIYPEILQKIVHRKQVQNKAWEKTHHIATEVIKAGDIVFLRDENRRSKHEPYFIGPYKVLSVQDNKYLELIDGKGQVVERTITIDLVKRSELTELDKEYEVKELVQHRSAKQRRSGKEYLVKWKSSWILEKDWNEYENQVLQKVRSKQTDLGKMIFVKWKDSWVHESNIIDTQLITDYWKQNSLLGEEVNE
jgi:hypothetical protein